MEQANGDIFVGTTQVNPDALTLMKLQSKFEAGFINPDAMGDLGSLLGGLAGGDDEIDQSDNGIYRYRDGEWTQVLGSEQNPEFTGAGVREILEVTIDYEHASEDAAVQAVGPTSYLFAGTSVGAVPGQAVDDVAELWVSEDGGDTWSQITTGPSAPDSDNTSYRSFVQMGNKLIVTTEEPEGGAIWAYDVLNETWEQIHSFPGQPLVTELEVITEPSGQTALYVGTAGGFIGGAPLQVWRFVEGEAAAEVTESSALSQGAPSGWIGTNITPDSMETDGGTIKRGDNLDRLADPFNDSGVSEIFYMNGKLFIGTSDYIGAAALFYVELQNDPNDPIGENSWQLVTADGFGDDDNTYIWAETVAEVAPPENDNAFSLPTEVAYIGTFDQDDSFELLSSTDGDNWTKITTDAFGTDHNWGVRQMEMMADGSGDILIGTASNFLIPGLLEPPNDDLIERTRIAVLPDAKVNGDAADNLMLGGQFDDLLVAYGGDDLLNGGDGNDLLKGKKGSDDINGEAGNDTLVGGNGRDFLSGGENDDKLIGGNGLDLHSGGTGADTFVFSADGKADLIFDYSLLEGDLVKLKDMGPIAVVDVDEGDIQGAGILAFGKDGPTMEVIALGTSVDDLTAGLIGDYFLAP